LLSSVIFIQLFGINFSANEIPILKEALAQLIVSSQGLSVSG
jgi:hypothetical protein